MIEINITYLYTFFAAIKLHCHYGKAVIIRPQNYMSFNIVCAKYVIFVKDQSASWSFHLFDISDVLLLKYRRQSPAGGFCKKERK